MLSKKILIIFFTITILNASPIDIQDDSMSPFFVDYFRNYVKNIATGLENDFASVAENILNQIENFDSTKKADFNLVIDNVHTHIANILSNETISFGQYFENLNLFNLCHKYQVGSNARFYLIKKFLLERSATTRATYDQILTSKKEFTYFLNFYKLFLVKCYIKSEPEYLIDFNEFTKSTQDLFEQYLSFRRTRFLVDKSYKSLSNLLNDFEEFNDFNLSEEDIQEILKSNFYLWNWKVEILSANQEDQEILDEEEDFLTVSQSNRTLKFLYDENENIYFDFSNQTDQKNDIKEFFNLSHKILQLENFDSVIELPLIYLFKMMDLVYDDSSSLESTKKEALLKADYELFKYFKLNDITGVEDLNQKYIQNRFNKNECYCSCTNKKISGYFYLTEYKTGCDFHNFSKRNYTCFLTTC